MHIRGRSDRWTPGRWLRSGFARCARQVCARWARSLSAQITVPLRLLHTAGISIPCRVPRGRFPHGFDPRFWSSNAYSKSVTLCAHTCRAALSASAECAAPVNKWQDTVGTAV